VSIVFDDEHSQNQVITGMTGFTRLKLQREALVVPKSAVFSLSAGSAVVYVVNGNDWSIREVSIGYTGGEQVEILDGLIHNEKVLLDGHINLKVNDKIAVDQE
jgi:multidrug efflux pump subunit AcrA (membrane-fusion protein)